MSTPKAKPYKLKPTEGVMTRDDVSLWEYTLLASCRQMSDWQKFLPPSGEHQNWTSLDEDEHNGFYDDNVATQRKIRNDFANFITCLATHCPTGFMDTVLRESTSFKSIVKQIKNTYNLDSKGEKFLSLMDMKLEFSSSFTYEQGYMQVKDFCMESLLPAGARFRSRVLAEPEKLSPLAENFIMKEFLLKVHPRLPEHIRTTKSHLFTADRPTLACNKSILIDLMDSMLNEIENMDNIATATVRVNQITQNRQSRRNFIRPAGQFQGFTRGNNTRFSRPYRHQFPSRPMAPGRREDCSHCVEARRFDSSKGHSYFNCPFRQGLATPYQTPRQSTSHGSGMRVLLVQDPTYATQNSDFQMGTDTTIYEQDDYQSSNWCNTAMIDNMNHPGYYEEASYFQNNNLDEQL